MSEWLKPKKGKTPAVIVSVAHLDDKERALALLPRQNPMDVDYPDLADTGVWCIGRREPRLRERR